jgi:hypothetical protein
MYSSKVQQQPQRKPSHASSGSVVHADEGGSLVGCGSSLK